MSRLENCVIIENAPAFRKTEEGKTFELSSNLAFECGIYDIEKCLFKDADFKRCDWLFTVPKSREKNSRLQIKQPRAYYVELKGDNHSNACEQLFNAIDKTKVHFANFEFYALIVSSKGRQPDLRNNEFYKKTKRLIKREIIVCSVHKGNNNKHTESI